MTLPSLARRLGVFLVVLCCTAAPAHAADPPTLDLETLTAAQAESMLKAGTLTSVQLTQAYIDRITALNKAGAGLNAVTQYNPDALVEAAAMDKARAEGKNLGPAMGLPILLKDIIDDTKEYTSAGNYSLRNNYPAGDSGVSKVLRRHGVIILGKLGLSEFANYFGAQPAGFSNLTGQVLNGIDADASPSGSSSGSGSAAAAALSAMTIGTETNGSIIGPAGSNGVVGLRPTVGLVPGYGIAPIYASQDTAGPIVRDITAAAMTLQSIADPDDPEADAEYVDVFGPNYKRDGVIPTAPFGTSNVPDYMSALTSNFVAGKRIGFNGTRTEGSLLDTSLDALEAAGATVVAAPAQADPVVPDQIALYEGHKTTDSWYAHLGPDAPIQSLDEEVQDNFAHPLEALKFGVTRHLQAQQTDISPGGANETSFRANIRTRKVAQHASLDNVFNFGTPNNPSDDLIALVGSLSNTPVIGYPQLSVPMGYVATTRRAQSVNVFGPAYGERDMLGVGYVIEQATKLRQSASAVSPSQYRCANTIPVSRFASRGHCNPDSTEVMDAVGTRPDLGFSLETESASSLQQRMSAGTLSAETLTKAYLARIALSNANGPALQAVRDVDAAAAIARAKSLDAERADGDVRGPLHGVPVLVDDVIDVKGFPTTAGSIALQDSIPSKDSRIVTRLKAAGAIVLGKTNVTELNGLFDSNIPEGYSSLGGQVLTPFDTDKNPAGSSGGSAAATSAGLAAITVGLETSTDTAQLIAPASVAGVVALKPTVGRISRTGVLGVARSQDSPGPMAKTVRDVADALAIMAVRDASDTVTLSAPAPGAAGTDYTSGLTTTALNGKRIGIITNTAVPYPDAVTAVQRAGATTAQRTIGTPSPNPASITTREFKRDLNAYLGTVSGGASSLSGIIDYNTANAQEGLKYQQRELTDAQAVDLGNSATNTSYTMDRDQGRTSNQALIDGLLTNNTANDSTDDVEAMMVPFNSALVGIADRAGYPVLTVPAGYLLTTNNGLTVTTHNPTGVAFIGTKFSEATLLADGYAFEQATKARVAPSLYNPGMWRCVPGSTYFRPYRCHPGDPQLEFAFNAVPTVAPTASPSATPTPTAAATTTATATPPTTPGTPPATPVTPGTPPAGTVPPGLLTTITTGLQKESLQVAVGKKVGGGTQSLKFSDSFLGAGTASYTLRIKVGRKLVTLGKKTVKPTKAGSRTVKLTLGKSARKRLRKHPKSKVTLKTVFKPASGGARITTVRTVKRK